MEKSPFVLFTACILTIVQISVNGHHFPFDTERPIIFDRSGHSSTQYSENFGVSLRLVEYNSQKWLIVGAPGSRFGSEQGGTIFSCPLPTGSCQKLISSERGTVGQNEDNLVANGLGSTLVTDHLDYLVSCAPRTWMNDSKSYHSMWGGCFKVPWAALTSDEMEKTDMTSLYSFEGFEPLKDTKWWYGMACSGFSSEAVPNAVIVGNPGFNKYSGNIGWISNLSLYKEERIKVPGDLKQSDGRYFGYNIAIVNREKNAPLLLAIGAPRAFQMKGAFWVAEFHVSSEKFTLLSHVTAPGTLGSYFGSVLAAFDVDEDGSNELFVGAPHDLEKENFGITLSTNIFKTKKRLKRSDTGRVYVYKIRKKQPEPFIILSGEVGGGMFGSAISSIGDTHGDGKMKFAIAAPNQLPDDSKGVVYIYGNDWKLIEKIEGKQFPHIAGFGSSLSNSMDIDGDGLPDLAIGSSNNAVVLLRSSKMVKINAHMSCPSQNSNGECEVKRGESFAISVYGSVREDVSKLEFPKALHLKLICTFGSVNVSSKAKELNLSLRAESFKLTYTMKPAVGLYSKCAPQLLFSNYVKVGQHYTDTTNEYTFHLKRTKGVPVLSDTFMYIKQACQHGCVSNIFVTLKDEKRPLKIESNSNNFTLNIRNTKDPAMKAKLFIKPLGSVEGEVKIEINKFPGSCTSEHKGIVCKLGTGEWFEDSEDISLGYTSSNLVFGKDIISKKQIFQVTIEAESKLESTKVQNLEMDWKTNTEIKLVPSVKKQKIGQQKGRVYAEFNHLIYSDGASISPVHISVTFETPVNENFTVSWVSSDGSPHSIVMSENCMKSKSSKSSDWEPWQCKFELPILYGGKENEIKIKIQYKVTSEEALKKGSVTSKCNAEISAEAKEAGYRKSDPSTSSIIFEEFTYSGTTGWVIFFVIVIVVVLVCILALIKLGCFKQQSKKTTDSSLGQTQYHEVPKEEMQ